MAFIDAKITPDEALKFRDETWAEYRCSCCDKIPPDFDKMVARNNVRICDLCVAEFQRMFSEEPNSNE